MISSVLPRFKLPRNVAIRVRVTKYGAARGLLDPAGKGSVSIQLSVCCSVALR